MLFAKIHVSAKKTDSSGFFFVVRLIFLKNNILILLAADKETLRICLNDRVEYPVNGLPSAIRQSGHDAYRYENEEFIMTAQGISLSERGVSHQPPHLRCCFRHSIRPVRRFCQPSLSHT